MRVQWSRRSGEGLSRGAIGIEGCELPGTQRMAGTEQGLLQGPYALFSTEQPLQFYDCL